MYVTTKIRLDNDIKGIRYSKWDVKFPNRACPKYAVSEGIKSIGNISFNLNWEIPTINKKFTNVPVNNCGPFKRNGIRKDRK